MDENVEATPSIIRGLPNSSRMEEIARQEEEMIRQYNQRSQDFNNEGNTEREDKEEVSVIASFPII